MALDSTTLNTLREIMAENFTDLADIYRKTVVTSPGDTPNVSDGMGGFIYNKPNLDISVDERTLVLEDVKCRVTVPRSNRESSEYESDSVRFTESRAIIIFPHDTAVKEGDRVDVTARGRKRSYEITVIADHSESYSLQTNCVELNVLRV